jgi:hypothetical protein
LREEQRRDMLECAYL